MAAACEGGAGRLEGGLSKKDGLYLAKAVSAMQACAVHLCDRSPRR